MSDKTIYHLVEEIHRATFGAAGISGNIKKSESQMIDQEMLAVALTKLDSISGLLNQQQEYLDSQNPPVSNVGDIGFFRSIRKVVDIHPHGYMCKCPDCAERLAKKQNNN